jgi:hypothetical protein
VLLRSVIIPSPIIIIKCYPFFMVYHLSLSNIRHSKRKDVSLIAPKFVSNRQVMELVNLSNKT